MKAGLLGLGSSPRILSRTHKVRMGHAKAKPSPQLPWRQIAKHVLLNATLCIMCMV
jgi:hypothetical protein